ncbi:citrate transporter, partial [Bacillus cereus]|nr:citrate transporter [Bacillus cereus]
KKERTRLGNIAVQYLKQMQTMDYQAATVEAAVHKRPNLLWLHFLLSATLLVCLILEVMPLPVLFAVAFDIAVMIN